MLGVVFTGHRQLELQRFNDPQIAGKVLALYPQMSSELRKSARGLLCSRPAWAMEFLKAVQAGRIAARDVPVDQIRQIALHRDQQLDIGSSLTGVQCAIVRSTYKQLLKMIGRYQPRASTVRDSWIGGARSSVLVARSCH